MHALLLHPDYPQSFWSFEVILGLLGKKSHSPPLGLLTVAALLPDDWTFTLVDERIAQPTESQWSECDIVLISGMHVQRTCILKGIKEAKKRGKRVVIGGPWVFHHADQALEAGADIVAIGEAEYMMDELLTAIKEEKSGHVIKAEIGKDLETTPVPRFDLIDMNNYLEMDLQFTRGCPFHCEFCDVTLMFGKKARTKSAEQIIKELNVLYERGWSGYVFFVDDNFVSVPGRAKKVLKAVAEWQAERGYPFLFTTQASVNLADDDELLELMVKAGFFRVFLGIESTDVESLLLAKKGQNAKRDLVEVCTKVCKAGLQIIAGCILGFDNEKAGAGDRIRLFAEQSKIADVFITILQAPPGSLLWKRLENEGRSPFETTGGNEGNSACLMNFEPTRPVEEIVDEFIAAYDVLYEPNAYLERAYAQFRMMDPLPYNAPIKVPKFNELKAMFVVALRQGLLRNTRFTFWKLMLKALWNFPERLDKFIASAVFLEHLYEFKQTIAKELRNQLTERKEMVKAAAGD